MANKAIAEISVEAKLLHQALKAVAIGGTITWTELAHIIGRPVTAQQKGYGALQTARKRALVDDGLVFEAVHKIGLKRLNDSEIVATGTHSIDRIRRIARRGTQKLLSVKEFDKLPNADKIRHNAVVSLLGAVQQIATENKVKSLEKHVTNSQAALPTAKALEIFKN